MVAQQRAVTYLPAGMTVGEKVVHNVVTQAAVCIQFGVLPMTIYLDAVKALSSRSTLMSNTDAPLELMSGFVLYRTCAGFNHWRSPSANVIHAFMLAFQAETSHWRSAQVESAWQREYLLPAHPLLSEAGQIQSFNGTTS